MRISLRRNVGRVPARTWIRYTQQRLRIHTWTETLRRPSCGGDRRGNGPGSPQGGGIMHATFTWQAPGGRAGGTIDLRFDAWTRVPPGELTPNYRADNNPGAGGPGGRRVESGIARGGWFEAAVCSRRKSECPIARGLCATPRFCRPCVILLSREHRRRHCCKLDKSTDSYFHRAIALFTYKTRTVEIRELSFRSAWNEICKVRL